MNKFSEKQFIHPRICVEALQILLIAEQNLRFCSRPQRKRFGMRGNDVKRLPDRGRTDSEHGRCRLWGDYGRRRAGLLKAGAEEKRTFAAAQPAGGAA